MATPSEPNSVAQRQSSDAADSRRPAGTRLASVISSPGVSAAAALVTLLYTASLAMGGGQLLMEQWWRAGVTLFAFVVARSFASAHIRMIGPLGDAGEIRVEPGTSTLASVTSRFLLPVAALCVTGNLASHYLIRRAEDRAARADAGDDPAEGPSPVSSGAGAIAGRSNARAQEHSDRRPSTAPRSRVSQLWRRELVLAAEPRSPALRRHRRPEGARADRGARASGAIWVESSNVRRAEKGPGPDTTAKPVEGARAPGPNTELPEARQNLGLTSEYVDTSQRTIEYQTQLQRVLAYHKQKLHRCYEQRRDRGAKGRIGVVFTFSADSGEVQDCTVIDDEIGERPVRDCVCQEILGWWLPRDAQASGLHTVRKGWNFSR